jgi:murein DD-endopeptidase MepM/ murein hydrolase activator NlpD
MRVLLLVVCLLSILAAAPGQARADGGGPAVWPLQPQPEVIHPFDPPDDPWGAGHRGVDLLGRPGQEVHAALAGTVTFAGTLAGRGVVVVSHGVTRTTYEPVDPGVAVGTAVLTGGVIGHLQAATSHCFPLACLHWGLLRGEVYLDPLSLLGAGPVRLLPLSRPVTPTLSPPLTLVPALMRVGAPAGTPSGAVLR